MLDISTITDAPSAWVDIKHPVTGEPVGASIELAGPEHPDRKKLEFGRARRLRALLSKTGKLEAVDPEEEALQRIDELAALTLDWKGITDQGEPVPFGTAAAGELYRKVGWLRDQMFAAVNERDRFIKSSAAS